MFLTKENLSKAFSGYKEKALSYRRFKHQDLLPLLQNFAEKEGFKLTEEGFSYEKRSIYSLKWGEGDVKIMLWSQMHGDEPTASMALFDLFNFLAGVNDEYDPLRKALFHNIQILAIPMLNPDGAERYQRRTALEIDMNRDARALITAEAQLLKRVADEFKPAFGFNLHNQNPFYNMPGTDIPVALSFLAPAYDYERNIHDTRSRAMQLIACMAEKLQETGVCAIARYDDEHTPRGFGDNFQKWEVSTVLVESGWVKGDMEQQQVRELNFDALLQAFYAIATKEYQNSEQKDYFLLPENDEKLHHIIIRDLEIAPGIRTDVAVRRSEITEGRDFYVEGYIEDIGDLKDYYGYEEVDASQLIYSPSKVYSTPFQQLDELTPSRIHTLLQEGFGIVQLKEKDDLPNFHRLPFQIFTASSDVPPPVLKPESSADFFMKTKEGSVVFAILNGMFYDVNNLSPVSFNQKIYTSSK